MEHKKPLDHLLSSEMNRREFLGFVGAASLTVIGASSIIKGLTEAVKRPQQTKGYGSSTYGEATSVRSTRPTRSRTL